MRCYIPFSILAGSSVFGDDQNNLFSLRRWCDKTSATWGCASPTAWPLYPAGTTTITSDIENGDLNIRFNKFSFLNGQTPEYYPLGAEEYPITGSISSSIKTQSNAISVIIPGDPSLDEYQPDHYLALIGGAPSMPNYYDDSFWNEFQEVVTMQMARRANVDPRAVLELPLLWENMDIHQVSAAVHDEYPGAHQASLHQWLWSQNAQIDHDILPFRSNFDFVGQQVLMADLNTWAIGAVAPTNFYLKWYVGRPRPEEVAWKIATGELTDMDGIPVETIADVLSMNLTSAADFTAYTEGSPRHPSWPAMHSAASSSSFWVAVIMNLTPEQYCEALRVDYAVSFARTCAGVHYSSDNIAGLNLGQHMMAEKLPDYLAFKYGSPRGAVRAKIERLRFNWNDFDSRECLAVK